jgi:hypothetical protein
VDDNDDDAHVRVDTPDGYGEHAVEGRVRENDKGDQIAHGENAGKETRLDGTTDKSVQNRIRLAETSPRAGEDGHQRRW